MPPCFGAGIGESPVANRDAAPGPEENTGTQLRPDGVIHARKTATQRQGRAPILVGLYHVPCRFASPTAPRAGLGRSTDRRHKTSRDETCARRSREESWRDKIRDRWAGVVVAHPPGPWGETTKSGRHGLAILVPRDLRPASCGPAISERIHTVMGTSLVCLGSRPASLHIDGRRVSSASPLGGGRVESVELDVGTMS